jgi:hypothetical protein
MKRRPAPYLQSSVIAKERGTIIVVIRRASAHSDEVGRRFRAKPAACTD